MSPEEGQRPGPRPAWLGRCPLGKPEGLPAGSGGAEDMGEAPQFLFLCRLSFPFPTNDHFLPFRASRLSWSASSVPFRAIKCCPNFFLKGRNLYLGDLGAGFLKFGRSLVGCELLFDPIFQIPFGA